MLAQPGIHGKLVLVACMIELTQLALCFVINPKWIEIWCS